MGRMETTARARELGLELRRHRRKTGLTGDAMAALMGVSTSKVSRMETGRTGATEIDVAIHLALCRVDREVIDDLLDLARDIESDGPWLRPHVARVPDVLRSLVIAETTASTIYNFEPLLIPGLLETPEYAAGVIRGVVNVDPDVVSLRVDARLSRQRMLRRKDPAQFIFFINELALHTPVGDPQQMQEQMLHLMFLADQPHITIRVMPARAGAHGAMRGAFMLMEYDEHRPVVHVETELSSLFYEGREEINTYRAILGDLSRNALDAGESRSLFADMADYYDRAHGEHSDRVAQEQLQQHG